MQRNITHQLYNTENILYLLILTIRIPISCYFNTTTERELDLKKKNKT